MAGKPSRKPLVFQQTPVYNTVPCISFPKEDDGSMPVYEYECSSCGGRFEAVQKFSDPVLTVCRLCSGSPVRKVLSAPAFVLKGSGWYVTDYPSADRKKASEEGKPASPAADTKSPACAGSGCPSKS
jgi:putative FmdB family regulatory protein